jgi:glycosyltransferase involved in cell wall biosynthesis
LVAALGAVADAPSSFAQVRERALERAAQFSWRTTAERTREVYDEARRRFRK